MSLLIAGRPLKGTPLSVQGTTQYSVDSEGRIWYRHQNQRNWYSRGETSEQFRERLKSDEEGYQLANYASLHRGEWVWPGSPVVFGPLDQFDNPPLTENETRCGYAFGE